MMQHHNLPTGPTLFQLRLQPVTLGQQVRQFPIAVEQEELHRAVVERIDLIVTHLGI